MAVKTWKVAELGPEFNNWRAYWPTGKRIEVLRTAPAALAIEIEKAGLES